MPRLKPKFKDDQIVVAIESFVTSSLPAPFRVAAGSRWRGDHPVVKNCAAFFTADGTPHDEVARLRATIYREAEPPPPPEPPERTRIEQRIPEDAVVSISGDERVHKNSSVARNAPGRFVPVIPPELGDIERRDALVAIQTMSTIGEGAKRERIVYAGQWVHQDDPLVVLHPETFVLPMPERKED